MPPISRRLIFSLAAVVFVCLCPQLAESGGGQPECSTGYHYDGNCDCCQCNGCNSCSPCTVCDGNTQYALAEPTLTSDRQCAWLTVCSGSQYETVAPTATSDRHCTPLAVCGASEYEAVAPTATSNRQCASLTICSASEYEAVAPTATSNRQCTALAVCGASEYEAVAPTATSNRQCAALTNCSASEYEAVAPTATSDRVCRTQTATPETVPPPTGSPVTPSPPNPTPVQWNGWANCPQVIAIPGTAAAVTNAQCAVCNNGAFPYWPCNDPSLCYCQGSTIPPQYLLPFSGCSNVVAVPGQLCASSAQCAICNNGQYRWWPCGAEHVGVLCYCAAQSTPTPSTVAPVTPQPTPVPWSGWASCPQVIAIPGNAASVTNAQCAVCNNGAYPYWPCDNPSLCYCQGSAIPPQYLLPFSGCSNVVAVPGQYTASSAQCAICNNGQYRWWPCGAEHVGVLCYCAAQSTPSIPTPILP